MTELTLFFTYAPGMLAVGDWVVPGGIGAIAGTVIAAILIKLISAKHTAMKNAQKQRELEKFRTTIDSKTEEIHLLSKSQEEKEQQLNEYKSKVSQLEEDLVELEKQLSQAKQEGKTSKEQLEDYEKQLAQANQDATEKGKKLAQLQEELNETSVSLQTATNNLKETESKLEETEKKCQELDENLSEQSQLLEETQSKLETQEKRVEELEERNSELEEQLPELKDECRQNQRLRLRAIRDVKRVLEHLESAPISEDLHEEISGEPEEEEASESLTAQLMEQEKIISDQRSKIKNLQDDAKIRDEQDEIIRKQAEKIEDYEQRLTDIGKLRAELVDKDEIIKEKSQKISEYLNAIEQMKETSASESQQVAAVGDGTEEEDMLSESSVLEAIDHDMDLKPREKKTMTMLYSQLTSKKKKNS